MPPLDRRLGRLARLPHALGLRVGRRHADQGAQVLADLAEVEALRQGEHVTLGVGHRVPPALAAVVDDHHLLGTAAVPQAVLRAVLAVQAAAAALQQQRAAHRRP